MRRKAYLRLFIIALITFSALFFSHVHVHATTTVTVDPLWGMQTTSFDASATTTLSPGVEDYCNFAWRDPTNYRFRNVNDDSSPYEDTWTSSTGDTPSDQYRVVATFINGDTLFPLEDGDTQYFEVTVFVPVFPLGFILPIMALILAFVFIDKKYGKPHGSPFSSHV